jgi:hypothetical protein
VHVFSRRASHVFVAFLDELLDIVPVCAVCLSTSNYLHDDTVEETVDATRRRNASASKEW